MEGLVSPCFAPHREWLAAVVHVTPLLSWEQRKPVARLVSRAVLLEPPSALVVLEAVSAELEVCNYIIITSFYDVQYNYVHVCSFL